ncbi:hypothetical protein [Streptomyces termitum]|uniref:hypothetical protein n=1 Tax=Streptomyces termitum TaxID=67368 RepID=UPI0033A0E0F3
MASGIEETYEEACARIGVDPGPECWPLRNAWSDGDLKVTMTVLAPAAPRGRVACGKCWSSAWHRLK